jgi:uncharacterized RDD family membrane protein YckC
VTGNAPDRAYTNRVVVALVIGAVLGFMVPMVAVIGPMVWGIASGGLFRIGRAPSAAIWNDALYYTTFGSGRYALHKSELGSDRSQKVGVAGSYVTFLVPTDADLYAFSLDRVERFDGTRVHTTLSRLPLITHRPFVHRGRPAILEATPGSIAILAWDGHGFVPSGSMPCSCAYVPSSSLHALAEGDQIDLFALISGEVRHHRAKIGEAVGAPASWTLVLSDVAEVREAPLAGGTFALAGARIAGRSRTEVEILRFDGRAFLPVARAEVDTLATNFGFTSSPALGRTYLAAPGNMNGDLDVKEFDASGFLGEHRPSSGPGFFSLILYANFVSLFVLAVVSVSLAFALSRLMQRHRQSEYRVGDRVVVLASLTRRGFAQMVDTLFRSLPFLIVLVLILSGHLDWQKAFTPPRGPLYIMGFALLSLVWMVIELFLMSVAEWRTGKTPGKWLFGIRALGDDLAPLGFGRALLRNLTELADGMFNFGVGMGVAAFTEKRQRLGDLAAKSIVIDERKSREQSRVEE